VNGRQTGSCQLTSAREAVKIESDTREAEEFTLLKPLPGNG
jgi:hypothetical protein